MAGTETRYCPNCGERISARSRFCPSCGARQEDFAVAEAEPAPVEEPLPGGADILRMPDRAERARRAGY